MNIQNKYLNARSNYLTENSTKVAFKKLISIPQAQFILFGIVLIILQLISQANKQIISSAFISICSAVMIYTIVSVGFSFLLGYAGLVSLGTSCFVGIGAYSAFYIMQQNGLPYILGLVMAMAIAVILGLAIGFVSLRIQGIFLGIITMGLSEIIRYALKAIYAQTVTIKSKSLKLFGIVVRASGMYYLVAVLMVAILILTFNLMRSPTGKAMLAMKNSTSAAQAFGVNLIKNRILAFILACVYAAIGGVCYMTSGFSIIPTLATDAVLSLTLSLNVLAAVIIGGAKSLWGTVVGVVFVFGLSKLLSVLLPLQVYSAITPYISIITGVLIIVIVMFYPGGFTQLAWEIKYKNKVRKEKRRVRLYGTEE